MLMGRQKPEGAFPKYRHELKYYISYGEYLLMSERLKRTLKRDPYSNENGEYHIRSLYFDDFHDSSVRTKLGGDNEREKIRIRIYNMSDTVIKLESKKKSGQYITKTSVSISREQADMLCGGDPKALLGMRDALSRHMYAQMRSQLLKPVVLVDYFREAYLHPAENVRITFDKELSSGVFSKNLFSAVPTAPVLEHGTVVLEIKFARFLPAFVQSLVQCEGASRSAISKYVICRRFE